MDLTNHVRACDREQVVVPLQVAAVVRKASTAEVRLAQLVALNHRAHGAIHHEDALGNEGFESLADRVVVHGRGVCSETLLGWGQGIGARLCPKPYDRVSGRPRSAFGAPRDSSYDLPLVPPVEQESPWPRPTSRATP